MQTNNTGKLLLVNALNGHLFMVFDIRDKSPTFKNILFYKSCKKQDLVVSFRPTIITQAKKQSSIKTSIFSSTSPTNKLILNEKE